MRQGISTKLLLAILVAVTLPLGTSAALLLMAVDHSFQVGVNRQVQDGLELAPEAYRALFDALKSDFEHSTDGIVASSRFTSLLGGDPAVMQAYLARLVAERDDLLELRLEDADGRALAAAGDTDAFDSRVHRRWTEERDVRWDGGDGRLVALWIAPRRHFDSFEEAGQILETYETLRQGRLHLRSRYVMVYLAMVGVVVLIAVALGFLMSRRVTTRVSRLCEATRQVAAGDLTTRVPEGPGDEVGELSSAFNAMVEQLLEGRERIEYLQRVAAWQQLARRLAHEIKNPLTPIQLAVQELRDRYKGDDEPFRKVLFQATEIVTEEVEALRRLTTEFSSFAKLPAVDAQPTDLRGFLEEASQALALLASERAKVEVELPPAGIDAAIDRMLMRRVLDNLVRNAVEAIDGSGGDGQVVVRAGRTPAGQPVIEVEDDGPGIAEEERERVFEPYYTTKDEGTGLGLAIVKKIVLEHGGHVSLEPVRPPPAEPVTARIRRATTGSFGRRAQDRQVGEGERRGAHFVIRLRA